MTQSPMKSRLAFLDLTRFVLALSIMLFHFRNFAPGLSELNEKVSHFPANNLLKFFYVSGDFAVPMFWAISGAMITYTYQNNDSSFRNFFVNRFARLYPLHIVTLVIVSIIQIYSRNQYDTFLIYDGNNWRSFLLHLLFLPGFSTSAALGFNAPIWSVSVELFTYLVYGALCIRFKVTAIKFAILNFFVTQFIFLVSGRHPVFLCLSYFCLGIIAYEMRKLSPQKNIALVIFCVLSSCLLGRPSVLVIVTLVVVFFNIKLSSQLNVKKDNSVLLRKIEKITGELGNLTYGIYLWHIPIQMLLVIVLRAADIEINDNSLTPILFSWLVFTILASWLSLRWFERRLKAMIINRLSS
ncbi:MAG: acyltransferase [Actinobacteria bacterium]|nr:acyltransferase [Actinomycetota bacterium]